MLHSTLLLLHISGATVGLLSGFAAMSFRKGSNWHGAAGTVFFASMLLMTGCGAILAAFLKPNRVNLVVSLLTFYLVSTAWRAAKQREGGTTLFDRIAFVWVLLVGVMAVIGGFQAAGSPRGMKDGMPAAAYFIFGFIALFCSVTDLRMLIRGGVAGSQRIVRHLWRMCGALLIATLSFYPGQAKLFPMWLRETQLLLIPALLLFGSMLYWRIRMRRKKVRRGDVIVAAPGEAIVNSLATARAPASF